MTLRFLIRVRIRTPFTHTVHPALVSGVFSYDGLLVLSLFALPARSLCCQRGPAAFICFCRDRKTLVGILERWGVRSRGIIVSTFIIRRFARSSPVRITTEDFIPQLLPSLIQIGLTSLM